VNQLLPYEQVITDKLSHTTIPDMADEIWAVIETELGPDSPTNHESADNSLASSPSGITRTSWLKFLIVAIVTMAVLLIVKKRNINNYKQKNTPVVPAIENNMNKDSVVITDSFSLNPATPINKEINRIPIKPMIIDSTAEQIILPDPPSFNKQADSIAITPQVITLPKDNPIILKPDEKQKVPEKKGKGAKGIKDTDYKIVSKNKDSL
jgi:hypothetical protein